MKIQSASAANSRYQVFTLAACVALLSVAFPVATCVAQVEEMTTAGNQETETVDSPDESAKATPAEGSLADALLDAIRAQGIAKAQQWFEQSKSSPEYDFRVNDLDAAGHVLLRSGNIKHAIAVFELNVKEFPQSARAFSSLGEAYWKHGEKKAAIKQYKKSIELDPENSEGFSVLEKLID
jgi:tetratricopeptide (TPR) repeat protein